MKTTLWLVLVFAMMTMSLSLFAQTGFAVFTGMGSIKLDERTTFGHDTNPLNSYLPNSNVHGSAGVTTLAGDISHYLDFGISYQGKLYSKYHLTWGAYAGYASLEQDQTGHPNDNSIHPYPRSFVIECSGKPGAVFGADVDWHLDKIISVGIKEQALCVEIENGSDNPNIQTGQYVQSYQNKSIETIFSGGPGMAVHLWHFDIGIWALFGKDWVEPNMMCAFGF